MTLKTINISSTVPQAGLDIFNAEEKGRDSRRVRNKRAVDKN